MVWANFPLGDDTLLYVFQFLRPQDWLQLACINRQCERITSYNILWRPVYDTLTVKYEIDPMTSKHVAAFCYNHRTRRRCRVRTHYSGLKRVQLKRRFRNLKARVLPRLRKRFQSELDDVLIRARMLHLALRGRHQRATVARQELIRLEEEYRDIHQQLVKAQSDIKALY